MAQKRISIQELFMQYKNLPSNQWLVSESVATLPLRTARRYAA